MIEQGELFEGPKPSRKETDVDLLLLLRLLEEHGGWMTRKTLVAKGMTARAVRAAGEASGGRLIFGQKGVKAASCATAGELHACANALLSQARKNTARAITLQAMAYAKQGKEGSSEEGRTA